MTLRVRSDQDAYRIAHAAGGDAADRRMRRAGRAAWDAEDRNHAAATCLRVMATLLPDAPDAAARPRRRVPRQAGLDV